MALEEKGLIQGSTDAESNSTAKTRKRKKHVVEQKDFAQRKTALLESFKRLLGNRIQANKKLKVDENRTPNVGT